MNFLSLFAGIGGLDLGLERAGMTCVGQVEIDPYCQQVLAKHWPEVPRHDDVRTAVEWWGDRPAPDVVCGGFPCQPVSQAGRKRAQADNRWLWPALCDVVSELRPRYALMENVPGLLRRGMGDVLGDLAALGYDAEWESVPAAAVGAPHIRDRVFIIGYRASASAERPGRDGLLADPASSGQRLDQDGANRSAQRSNSTDAQRSRPDVADPEGQRRELRTATGQRPGRLASGGAALADSNGEARSLSGSAGKEVFRSAPVERLGRCGSSGGDEWATEPDVGRVAHGIPRRVDRLRTLGNAVVPQVAEYVGRLILTADSELAERVS